MEFSGTRGVVVGSCCFSWNIEGCFELGQGKARQGGLIGSKDFVIVWKHQGFGRRR